MVYGRVASAPPPFPPTTWRKSRQNHSSTSQKLPRDQQQSPSGLCHPISIEHLFSKKKADILIRHAVHIPRIHASKPKQNVPYTEGSKQGHKVGQHTWNTENVYRINYPYSRQKPMPFRQSSKFALLKSAITPFAWTQKQLQALKNVYVQPNTSHHSTEPRNNPGRPKHLLPLDSRTRQYPGKREGRRTSKASPGWNGASQNKVLGRRLQSYNTQHIKQQRQHTWDEVGREVQMHIKPQLGPWTVGQCPSVNFFLLSYLWWRITSVHDFNSQWWNFCDS